jgi:CheY-like chemotaxis protein
MSHRTKRVLVVDDNVDSADLTAEILRIKGLEVSVAHGSQAALDLVPTFLPDVALLDIGLPEMDGYELARRIAQLVIGCRLIAVTGYGNAGDRANSQAAGFAAHLTKPVTTADLLAAIAADDPVGE